MSQSIVTEEQQLCGGFRFAKDCNVIGPAGAQGDWGKKTAVMFDMLHGIQA